MKSIRAAALASVILASSISIGVASRPQQQREPASRAAVVLTWDQAQREAGFAGMERIFLTRTVRASDRPRRLADGVGQRLSRRRHHQDASQVRLRRLVDPPGAGHLSEKIWRPYGMERDAEWMLDDIGHEQGGCCLAMTLRDLGRFGQFILDGARIGQALVVTETWLQEATRSQVSTGGSGSGYGYQWWTRAGGAFEGRGIYGQTLHIDPTRRLVIAINSAAEQPTGRTQGQARQDFIAAVKAEIDRE
jgi:hypothetical protein